MQVYKKIRYVFWKNSETILWWCFTIGILFFLIGYSAFFFMSVNRITKKKYPNSTISTFGLPETQLHLAYGGSVDQTFTIDDMGFSGLKIKMKLSKEDNAQAQVILYEEDSRDIVQEWIVDRKQIKKSGIVKLELDEVERNVSGKKYRIVICDTSNADLTVYLTTSKNLEYAETYYLSELQDADLIFAIRPYSVSYNNVKWMYVFIVMLIMIGYIVITIMCKKRCKPQNVFLVFALIFGIVYLYMLPPYASPDEQRHYAASYRISNQILNVKDTDEKYVACRSCDNNHKFTSMPTFETYRYMLNTQFEKTNDNDANAKYKLAETMSGVIVFSHLPQALGITLARLLHFGNTMTILMARFFLLLFYIGVVYISISIIPVGKYILLAIGALPIVLQQASSCSYDIYIYALAVLIISICLSCEREGTSWKKIIILFVVSLFAAPCKMVYCFLPFLMLAVPKRRFDSTAQRICGKVIVPLISVITSVVYNMTSVAASSGAENYIEWADEKGYTFAYALAHLKDTIYVWVSTFHNNLAFYISSTLGGSLGWVEITVPFDLLLVLIFILMISTKTEKQVFIKKSMRIYYILLFLFISILACASLFFAWTPISSGVIVGVQGRYFLPVLPLLLLGAMSNGDKNYKVYRRIMPSLMIVVNFLVFIHVFETIINR